MPAHRPIQLLSALTLLAVLFALSAGSAVASTIHACVKPESGVTRIVGAKAKCHHGEHKLSWDTTGPKGPAGANGAPGAAGTEGKAGANGAGTIFEAGNSSSVPIPPAGGALVVSKVLPPGSYTAAAKTTLVAESSVKGFTLAECFLEDQPGTDGTGETAVEDGAAWAAPLGEKTATSWLADSPLILDGSLTSSVTSTLSMVCLDFESQPVKAEASHIHALTVRAIQ
jgi:hypothetical protein